MNLNNHKKDFSIFVYNENLKLARLLKDSLSESGYECHFYSSKDLFLQAIYLTLPHIVVLPYDENTAEIISGIEQISKEIIVFLVGDTDDSRSLVQMAKKKICYDFLVDPVRNLHLLSHRLDKVAEKWLISLSAEEKSSDGAELFNQHIHDKEFVLEGPRLDSNLFSKIMSKTNEADLLDYILSESARIAGCNFIYLKNDLKTESLRLRSQSQGFVNKHKGLGVDYADQSPQEKENFLSDFLGSSKGKDFLSEVFDTRSGTTFLLENENQVFGLVVGLAKIDVDTYGSIKEMMSMSALIMDNIYKSKMIYDYLPLERRTFCYSNKNFYREVSSEISRARRLSLSASVATFEISTKNDSYNQRVTQLVARVLKRFTRSTDRVGRLSDQRFAVLLPHTDLGNTAKKTGSLLKIIEAAIQDKGWLGIEVSGGVSAFPQISSDSMGLLETSEEACDQANPFEVFVYQSYSGDFKAQP